MTQAEAKYMTVEQVAEELGKELGFTPHQVKTAIKGGKLRAARTDYAIEPAAVEDFKRDYVRLNGEGKPIIRRPGAGRRKGGRK